MANTLKFGNGKWYGKKDTILAYNDENSNYKPLPFDFSRASSATVINKDGLIETVGSGQPRIDYKDDSKGALLLEPSRTNLITDSQTFTGTLSEVNRQSNSADIVDPFGTNTAFKFTVLTSGADANTRITNSISITEFSISIYVNGLAGQKFELFLARDSYSQIFSTKEVLSGGWQRIELNGTFSTSSTTVVIGLEFGFTSDDSVAGQEYYLTGLQLEQGSFPTSYIPTSGSTVTRNAETCNGAGDAATFNDSEGVLMTEISALADGGLSRRISISHPSYDTSNRVTLELDESANTIKAFMSSGNSTVGGLTVNGINQTQNNKIAIIYKANTFEIYINGFLLDTDYVVASLPIGLSRLQFEGANGSNPFYGNTKQIQYYNSALTDSELEKISSWVSFSDMANGQQYSII